MKRTLVVIPTYNESDNIRRIIPAVLNLGKNFEVLIVDDNSPDGTGGIVEELRRDERRIHLIRRAGKMGLGTAYIDGFRYAIQQSFDCVFEMDADFSHDPNELPVMLEKTKAADVVVGSRYAQGVNVVNWPMRRLMLSYMANQYTRFVTGLPVHDATSGFVCWTRKVLETLGLDRVRSNGYSFQIEIKFHAWRSGFTIVEHPIIFVDRRVGESKMSKGIVYEAAWMVWKLKFSGIMNGIRKA